MKVTEQIDAMRALGTDPIQKLVTPRMIATALMLPCLTVIDDFIGMLGGWLIAISVYNVPTLQYWSTVWRALVWSDVAQGLIKPFLFLRRVADRLLFTGCAPAAARRAWAAPPRRR